MTSNHEFSEASKRGYGHPAKMTLWAHCPSETRKRIIEYLLGYRSVRDYLVREYSIIEPLSQTFLWSGYIRVNSIPAPIAWLVFFALGEDGFSMATLEREAPIHLGPRDAVATSFMPPQLMNNDGFFIR